MARAHMLGLTVDDIVATSSRVACTAPAFSCGQMAALTKVTTSTASARVTAPCGGQMVLASKGSGDTANSMAVVWPRTLRAHDLRSSGKMVGKSAGNLLRTNGGLQRDVAVHVPSKSPPGACHPRR